MIPKERKLLAKYPTPPRIESLKVRNFRALQEVEFNNLTPLTVLLGPNGSGKSTLFDVFAFLAECFDAGLRRAWDRRRPSQGAQDPRRRGGGDHRDRIPRTSRSAADDLPSGSG